jgi:hypothetical protein
LIVGQLARACPCRNGVHRRHSSIGFSLLAQFVHDCTRGGFKRLIHGKLAGIVHGSENRS